MWSSYGHELVDERVPGPVQPVEPAPALVVVARSRDVAHLDVDAVAPLVVEVERGVVEPRRSEAAADDAEQRALRVGNALERRRATARTGLPTTRRVGQRGARERDRDARTEPRRELVGQPGRRVLLVDHHRDPQQPRAARMPGTDA